ncbi:hypothetical protein [Phormidesmis priestleyi]
MQESVTYQAIKREGREEGIKEGREEGIEQGRSQTKREDAINSLREGIPPEIVARAIGLSIKEIHQLQSQNSPE